MKLQLKKLFVIGACVLQVGAFAGEAEMEAANELLDAMHFDQQMEQVAGCSIKMIKQQRSEMTEEEEGELKEFYQNQLFDKSYRNDVAALYANNFTCDEIRDIIGFYSTETGQKILQKLPELMRQTMVMMQQRLSRCPGTCE